MYKKTALELSAMLKKREISVKETVNLFSDRIKALDREYNSFITVTDKTAESAADRIQAEIDGGNICSPLAGVPVAIKDNICTNGVKTTCASKMLADFVPFYNATVVDLLEKNGAISLGKLNMDEFAMGSTNETSYFGTVKNPHNTLYVPGGSSGGAAAAVAACLTPYALGSDTGGSIRMPAAFCGVTGFKPSYGTVSRYGLIAYASSLDQIGPIAHDAADCAAVMDIIAGHDSKDSTSLADNEKGYASALNGNVKGLKIGMPSECFDSGVSDEVKKSVSALGKTLEELGAELVEIKLPFIKYVIPAYYIIAAAEASSNLSRFDGIKYGYRSENFETIGELISNTRSEGFGSEVKKRILLGTFVLSSGYYDAYYKKALKVKNLIADGFEKAFEKCDIILCPNAPSTAPKLGESLSDPLKMYLSDIFTVSANLAGLPALSLPCGFDTNGMPIGAQLIGAQKDDKRVLNAGYAYQKVTDIHRVTPKGV